ncbi:unnamed protein product [Phytophthora fragariaefolia]|uniref:Unnamed protein product n=1 Tax=Phytophthora fragariaefolia TaxID=1490495 RepID=A0A9W6XMF4_9STRA|nr:unnamed protein product [Phytophthora fragariaefolia]
MRDRLDQVHRALGLPVLPSAGYDPDSVAEEVANEEQALLEEMGVDFYASGSQRTSIADEAAPTVQRFSVDQQGTVHRSVYERLLRTQASRGMDAFDSRMAARLLRANDEAYFRWIAEDGRHFAIPTPTPGHKP